MKTPEKEAWFSMLKRCENPNSVNWKDYGGRGITVCEEWHDFTCFLADMGLRPSSAHSLDRKDNAKGYSKENCRWATKQQQCNNRRIISTNTTGILGVHKHTWGWRARRRSKGKDITLYKGLDFFEACCAVKSFENEATHAEETSSLHLSFN